MQDRRNRLRAAGWALGAFIAGVAAVGSSTARATLILTLSEVGYTSDTVTASDNSSGLTVGTITDPLGFGDYAVSIDLGTSNATDPGFGPVAQLQLHSLDITNNSTAPAHPLVLTLSDDDFNFPGNPGDTLSLTSSLGGSVVNALTNDSVTFQSYVNPGVGQVTPGPQTSTFTAFSGSQDFSVPNAHDTFVRGSTYELESVATFNLNNTNEDINVSGSAVTMAMVEVPEPCTVGLMMLGGMGLLGMRRRRLGV